MSAKFYTDTFLCRKRLPSNFWRPNLNLNVYITRYSQSIERMGNKVIDLGRTTTPEAISLGQYILESNNNQP